MADRVVVDLQNLGALQAEIKILSKNVEQKNCELERIARECSLKVQEAEKKISQDKEAALKEVQSERAKLDAFRIELEKREKRSAAIEQDQTRIEDQYKALVVLQKSIDEDKKAVDELRKKANDKEAVAELVKKQYEEKLAELLAKQPKEKEDKPEDKPEKKKGKK